MPTSSQNILITGGAGYIGSAVTTALIQKNYHVIIIDKKQRPIFFNQEIYKNLIYFQADFADQEIVEKIFTTYTISAVIHLAAYIEVGESVKNPKKYYDNNVIKTIGLLDCMVKYNIFNIIFSSSCAVYGLPNYLPLTEAHSKNPISPYGKTKLIVELALEDYARAYGLRFVNLRYFNAAGAWPEFNLGEQHEPESHVIPLLLQAAYTGQKFTIFGTDYETPDGTCMRDYLHIRDIALAHIQALDYLASQLDNIAVNLGTGTGYSVKQLIIHTEQITQQTINLQYAQRRAGDPHILLADPTLAYTLLHWKAKYSDLENIIKTAHDFHSKLFNNKQTIKQEETPKN